MSLHLLKLCVGVETVADLEAHVAERLEQRRRRNEPVEIWHLTRMSPKRASELLDGGSLFWVIRGQIAARQGLLGLNEARDAQGVPKCRIGLDPHVVAVRPRPCRPFQGWRYLNGADAPPDLDLRAEGVRELPTELCRELTRLGLL